jgi:predicted nucleotide-binding protein (sugar kinase/HSP70/actin superfamily)
MSTAQLARMVRARQDSKELRERVSKLSPHFDLSETEKIAQAEYDALVKQAALGKEAEKIEQDEAFKELEERFGQ